MEDKQDTPTALIYNPNKKEEEDNFQSIAFIDLAEFLSPVFSCFFRTTAQEQEKAGEIKILLLS